MEITNTTGETNTANLSGLVSAQAMSHPHVNVTACLQRCNAPAGCSIRCMQSETMLAVATGRSAGALKLILPEELLVYNAFVSELEVSTLLEFKASPGEVDATLS